jgi:hypothetical protein
MKKITLKDDLTFEHLWIPGHHNNIPETAIDVSDEVFLILSQNPTSKQYNPESELAVDYAQPFSFEAAFSSITTEIRRKFAAAMAPITADYTAEEIASFPTQEAEAKAYESDPNADTPLLDFMVANRPSVDKPTLVSRILANSVIYKQVAGPAIGKKQDFEDDLYALKAQHEDPQQPDVTQADFDAIVVDFS